MLREAYKDNLSDCKTMVGHAGSVALGLENGTLQYIHINYGSNDYLKSINVLY